MCCKNCSMPTHSQYRAGKKRAKKGASKKAAKAESTILAESVSGYLRTTVLSVSDYAQMYTINRAAYPPCIDASNAQMEMAFGRKGASCAEFRKVGNCALGVQGPDGKGVLMCCKSCSMRAHGQDRARKSGAKKGASKKKAGSAAASTVLSYAAYKQQYTAPSVRPYYLPWGRSMCKDASQAELEKSFGTKGASCADFKKKGQCVHPHPFSTSWKVRKMCCRTCSGRAPEKKKGEKKGKKKVSPKKKAVADTTRTLSGRQPWTTMLEQVGM